MGGCCSKNSIEDINKESTNEAIKKPNSEISLNEDSRSGGKKGSTDHQNASNNLDKEKTERINRNANIQEIENQRTDTENKKVTSDSMEDARRQNELTKTIRLEMDQNKDSDEKPRKKTSNKRIRRKKTKVEPLNIQMNNLQHKDVYHQDGNILQNLNKINQSEAKQESRFLDHKNSDFFVFESDQFKKHSEEDGELLHEIKNYSNDNHIQFINENSDYNKIFFSVQKIKPLKKQEPLLNNANEINVINVTEKSKDFNEVLESKRIELTESSRTKINSKDLNIEDEKKDSDKIERDHEEKEIETTDRKGLFENNNKIDSENKNNNQMNIPDHEFLKRQITKEQLIKEENESSDLSNFKLNNKDGIRKENEIKIDKNSQNQKNIYFENETANSYHYEANKIFNNGNISLDGESSGVFGEYEIQSSELDKSKNKSKNLLKPQENLAAENNLNEEVEEWKSLIERLMSNYELLSYAKAKTRTDFRELKEVGQYLAQFTNAKSIVEKAWLVYIWVTENIVYDFEGYKTGDTSNCSSQYVLETGSSVCEGYSNIFQDLCIYLGIECLKFTGYSKGFSYRIGSKLLETNHAWNAIRCGKNGKLRFIDSTWGSGYGTDDYKYIKRFHPYFFGTPDHVFNESHFSESYSSFDEIKKKTLEEFEKAPKNCLEFYILGLKCLNTVRCIIKTEKNPFFIEYSSPKNVILTFNLIDEKTGQKIENMTLVQSQIDDNDQDRLKHCLIAQLPEKDNNYLIRIYGIQKDASDIISIYDEVTSFIVIREGDQENNNIPSYNLSYIHDIRLKSHHSQFIRFDENPLVLEFALPEKINMLFKLSGKDGIQIEDQIKEIRTGTCLIVNVNLPFKNETYILSLFAGNGLLQSITQFHLLRTI